MIRRKNRSHDGHNEEDGTRLLRPDEVKARNSSIFNAIEFAPLNWKHLLALVLVLFSIKVAIRYELYRLPDTPDPVAEFHVKPDEISKAMLDTEHFVVARARRTLNELTSFGVRLAGTQACEEMALPWLLGELDNLRKQLNQSKNSAKYRLTFSADHVSGFFDLSFLSGFTSVYANVSNVLARLDPIGGDTSNALLVNAHYDTHFETPGASDDALNVAIMLEILRALLSSPTPLKHSVIFLFNGAEENILQASSGFVAGSSKAGGSEDGKGHPWAKDIRAFVNMEACGSGGREAMFQTGPGPATPILVRAYAEAVPYPYASVVGQELFQAGVIPSDTDFRIFRDHGGIPGVDFAFYSNGFVYHTKFDTPDRIPDGTIQRAGTNILALVRTIASMDLKMMPPVEDPNSQGEKLVYFDLFSSYFVVFPFKTVGLALNFLAIAGTLYRIVQLLFSDKHRRDGISYGKMLFAAIFAHLTAVIAAVGVLISLALLLSSTPGCMSWYGKSWLIFPIYVLPAICAVFLVHSAFFRFVMVPTCKTANFAQKCETAYDISFDAALLLCATFVGILSLFSVASSYVLAMWVGFPLISAVFMDKLIPLAQKSGRNGGITLLFRHAVLTLIPTIYYFYITDAVLELFIPITGRLGGNINPEVLISMITVITMALLLFFHAPALYLSGGHISPIIQLFFLLSSFSVITIILTPFGRPYHVDLLRPDGVHAQRSVSALTLQRFFVNGQEQPNSRSGLWFVPLDYNGFAPLKGLSGKLDSYINKARIACTKDEDPSGNPYCGLPYIFPITEFVDSKTYWIDMELSEETKSALYWPTISQMPTSPRLVTAGRWLVQYRVDCGDTPHCSIYISPHSHAALLKWHFGQETYPISAFPVDKLVAPPPPTDHEPRATWFVLLRFGSSSELTRLQQRSIVVTLELGASGKAAASGKDLLDLAIASQYFRGSSSNRELREIPSDLRDFVQTLPSWHATIPVTSLYSNYAF